MKSLLIEIDEELHRRLKVRAAEQGVSIKDFLITTITTALKKGGDKK